MRDDLQKLIVKAMNVRRRAELKGKGWRTAGCCRRISLSTLERAYAPGSK